MEKNQIVEVTIEDIGSNGEGIGKAGNFLLFVKDAVLGDRVKARVTRPKKNYAFARLEQVIEPSPYRVEPVCPYARPCGGCQLQALCYPRQLKWKEQMVEGSLGHIGGFAPEEVKRVMEEPIPAERPLHYRNKMQFPIGQKNGHAIAGFYAGRTHSIIPCTECALGKSVHSEALEILLRHMDRFHIPAYDEKTGKGLVRHLLVRTGEYSGQVMTCIIINGKKIPKEEVLVKELRQVPGMASIVLNENMKDTNVILGGKFRTLWGEGYIMDQLCGLSFAISPASFYQVNSVMAEKLYGKALEYAGLSGTETVWDLYCGIGTISLCLAKKARKVYGVEIVPQAVENAKENAERNGLSNAEFFCGKAEDVFAEQMEQSGGANRPDVAVVDPPRKGCDGKLLETLLAMQPERIVYVSCNSATLARDLKVLCAESYQLEKAVMVDQFAQTVHVECVVLMSRVEGK